MSDTRSLGFYHLLGGCRDIPNDAKAVKIELGPKSIGFKYGFKAAETYPLEHVVASVQTQQQITSRVTATRLLTTGIFAFALKKKGVQFDQFLHITVGEPGRTAEVVFDTEKAVRLADEINAAAALAKVPVGGSAAP